MTSSSISRLIFDTVPQIYESENGPYTIDIGLSDAEKSRFSTIVPLTADLKTYLDRSAAIWEELRPMTEGEITQIIEREWIQQKFAIAWLDAKTKISHWSIIVDYIRRLARRTTENRTLPKTLVIEPGEIQEGAPRLSDESYFKVFDWLGSSNYTYFRVDEKLGIKALEAISLTGVQDVKGYRFYPDFLHPVISSLKTPDSVVVHFSPNGGLIIADRDGVLASKRVGETWTIYDADHFIMSVAEIMKRQLGENYRPEDPACVACSLFQVLFDMSHKRHGGLIVLDHVENISKYVVRGIEREKDSPLSSIFTHSPFNGLEFSIPEVRKLVELSSVDGALILDLQGNLVQVGSMVVSHPSAVNRFGTRDAAAYSAAKYGATSLKVSADGQVGIFFTTPDLTGDDVHRFNFL